MLVFVPPIDTPGGGSNALFSPGAIANTRLGRVVGCEPLRWLVFFFAHFVKQRVELLEFILVVKDTA